MVADGLKAVAIGGTVATVSAVLVAPVVLPLVGFTAGSITAGSAAASMMSFVYTKGIGMAALSAMQSAGAVGTIGTSAIAATGTVGAAGGYAFRSLFRSKM